MLLQKLPLIASATIATAVAVAPAAVAESTDLDVKVPRSELAPLLA